MCEFQSREGDQQIQHKVIRARFCPGRRGSDGGRLPGGYCSVAKLCPTLYDPIDCSMPVFPILHRLLEFAQIHSIELVMPSNHLILCHPLLLLPSVFPSIRVFSNESAVHIRWPKDWSFSFSTSPSNEYSGLISFRMDWFDKCLINRFF